MKTIKANSQENSKWELEKDPLYLKIKTIRNKNLDDYPELKSLIKEFENTTLSSAKEFETNDNVYQTVQLVLSELEKKQTLNENDLRHLNKRVNAKVLIKSPFNEEEKFSILSDMIKIIAKVRENFLKPDTFKIINLIGNVIVNRANLSSYEMTWLFNHRISNLDINLRSAVICSYSETLNSETFSAVLGIANNLKLIDNTFTEYLQKYL